MEKSEDEMYNDLSVEDKLKGDSRDGSFWKVNIKKAKQVEKGVTAIKKKIILYIGYASVSYTHLTLPTTPYV